VPGFAGGPFGLVSHPVVGQELAALCEYSNHYLNEISCACISLITILVPKSAAPGALLHLS
jgi:hypothetical protein